MRIAVVAGADAGHALPALGVGAALRRRGHEVVLHTGAEHAETAVRHGVPLRELPPLPPAAPHEAGFGERMWTRAAQLARPLADGWTGAVPDLVLVDTLSRAGAFAAQLVDRPWVEVVGHHLSDPADDLPPVGMGRPMPRTPWRRANDRHLVARQRRSYADGAEQEGAAARSLGLAAPTRPSLRLLATLPSLERPRRTWPPDAHVVGSLAVDPAVAPLEPPAGDAPLVVVTDSTATGVDRSLGAIVLEGLRGHDVRIAVTSSYLAPRRDGPVVVGRGPHLPLLARADLAVGYGGGGFVSKAAAAGVPLVVVPLQGDQPEAAARLRDVGAGRTVPLRRANPRRLRRAVLAHLADDEARAAARRLAAEAAQLGPELAAGLVEAVADGSAPAAVGPRQHLVAGGAGPGG